MFVVISQTRHHDTPLPLSVRIELEVSLQARCKCVLNHLAALDHGGTLKF